MRFHLQATAGLCCLVPLCLSSAGPAPPSRAPSAPAITPAPQPSAASMAAQEAFAAQAAARHIKRTACIQEARTKKLVGSAKNDFIKDCVGH